MNNLIAVWTQAQMNWVIGCSLVAAAIALVIGILIGARIHKRSQEEEEEIAMKHHSVAARQLHRLQYERRQWN